MAKVPASDANDAGPADGLTAAQRALVAAMAGGLTATEAAAHVAVSVRSAYRWLGLPLVKAALAEARAATWRPVAVALKGQCLRSVEVLAAVRDADATPPAVRVKAAGQIITLACKLAELTESGPTLARIQLMLDDEAGATDDGPDGGSIVRAADEADGGPPLRRTPEEQSRFVEDAIDALKAGRYTHPTPFPRGING